jgi:hypothetical protein
VTAGTSCRRISRSTRREAELAVEQGGRRANGVERFGLAVAAIERERELHVEALAERLRLDERAQLGHELLVAAEREVRLQPRLEAGEPELLEPPRSGAECGTVRRAGERVAPPERERRAQSLRSEAGGVARELVAPDRHELLETLGVDRVAGHCERIAAATRRDRLGTERAAEP